MLVPKKDLSALHPTQAQRKRGAHVSGEVAEGKRYRRTGAFEKK